MSERLSVHHVNYQRIVRSANALNLEALIEWQIKALGIEGVHHPFKNWHPSRKWEFDFAHPQSKVGVEVQGGAHGRAITCIYCHRSLPFRAGLGHGTAAGLHRDYEKSNAAQELGWVLLQGDGEMVKSGILAEQFKRLIKARTS